MHTIPYNSNGDRDGESNGQRGRIKQAVAPLLVFHSFALVDIHTSVQRTHHQIRLILYREDGFSVSDLEDVHSALRLRLMVLLNDRDISLELSSPGTDYVFRHDTDCDIFTGKAVRLLTDADNVWHIGTLMGREDNCIRLKTVDNAIHRYAQEKVLKIALNEGARA